MRMRRDHLVVSGGQGEKAEVWTTELRCGAAVVDLSVSGLSIEGGRSFDLNPATIPERIAVRLAAVRPQHSALR
jgi:hypothetical protein